MSSGGCGATLLGVDVCLDEDKLRNAPNCPHGPTLLFERFVGDSIQTRHKQQYYACSACRDRKDCNFFQLVGEKVSEIRKKAREESNRSKQPWERHSDFYLRYTNTLNLKEQERRFCHQCNLLVLPNEANAHKGHKVTHRLSVAQMQRPSHLLRPIENKKTNAQYLFSDKAVDFLLDSISQIGFERVLCVGAPRIHEAIQADSSRSLESLLLDIDHRYGQFYTPDSFCRYNMFNHYFLDGAESQTVFSNFMCSNHGDGVVMVTDPPFGGLVEVLAAGVKWVMESWKQTNDKEDDTSDLPTMWIFPYFMESRITRSFPSFRMLDYKVAYDNHPLFQEKGKASKKGSPVRIFTNIAPSKFVLPKGEGYRYCTPCDRYVSAENHHCTHCQACTSKDGTTYRHCKACQRCVKPSYSHCKTCQKCELPTHSCNKTLQGCHICGAIDHKRRECPQRGGKQQCKQQQQRSNRSNLKKRKHPRDDSTLPKARKQTSEIKTNHHVRETIHNDSDLSKSITEDKCAPAELRCASGDVHALTEVSRKQEQHKISEVNFETKEENGNEMRNKITKGKVMRKSGDRQKNKRMKKKMKMKMKKRKKILSV